MYTVDSKKSINRSSDSIDKINDESIKKSESGKSIEMEKSDLNSDREIDESKLDSETSKKSVEKKSENGQFDDILSKFDQDFRSVGQLVLKVDKLKFVNDENDDDQNLNSDKEKMSKFKKKRRKNDENSTKNDDENEEITILDEKSDNSSTESESENQSKLTKIQKRRENKIEDQQIEEEEELTTNQLKADEQLKKLLKLRVNMNANELILQENDENYIENDGKLTKKNAVKVLSSGEEEEEKEDQIDDDENSQNSNFEDEILKEENSSDDDLDFKSPKKKFNSTKNKNKKRKNLVESNSELDENGENDDSDSDSGSKKKKKNSKVKPKSRGRKRRIAVSTEEEDDDDEENDDLDADSLNKKGRKEIRKIKKASSLQTDAYEEERERRKRIAEKQNMVWELATVKSVGDPPFENEVIKTWQTRSRSETFFMQKFTMFRKVEMFDTTMSNDTNSNETSIETLSHIFLHAQRPGYIFCISICALDIASGAFFLVVAKYPADIATHFYIKCSVVWEMMSSFVYAISNMVHLYNSLTDSSEATTMWRCFATFGSISYFCILASDYFSALVSVDRSISLLKPLTHEEFDKFR
uniref:Uncharacterized protein n=1 Tax=Romanomermis culicivorax TaxID=13658 RepID=A0A915K7N4_ROMCU